MSRVPTNTTVRSTSLLTVRQTAAELAVCRATVYNLITAGELRRVKIGKAARIPLDDVRALIERNAL